MNKPANVKLKNDEGSGIIEIIETVPKPAPDVNGKTLPMRPSKRALALALNAA